MIVLFISNAHDASLAVQLHSTEFHGITGFISFSTNSNNRRNSAVILASLQAGIAYHLLTPAAVWAPVCPFNDLSSCESYTQSSWTPATPPLLWPGRKTTAPSDRALLAGSTLSCATHANPPFVTIKQNNAMSGGNDVSGLSIDVFTAITSKLGFSVEYTPYTVRRCRIAPSGEDMLCEQPPPSHHRARMTTW